MLLVFTPFCFYNNHYKSHVYMYMLTRIRTHNVTLCINYLRYYNHLILIHVFRSLLFKYKYNTRLMFIEKENKPKLICNKDNDFIMTGKFFSYYCTKKVKITRVNSTFCEDKFLNLILFSN